MYRKQTRIVVSGLFWGVIFLDDLTWFYYYALHHITCATVLVNCPPQFPERRLSFYSLTPTPKGDCLFSKYRMRSKSLWFLRSDPLKTVTENRKKGVTFEEAAYITNIMYTWNQFDFFFGGLTFHFMGQIFQNMSHLGSRYIYLDIPSIHQKSNPFSIFVSGLDSPKILHQSHGISDFPPPSFNRVRPFRDVPSPWRPGNRKFSWHHPATSPCSPGFFVFSVVFLKTRKNKNVFFRSGDICCWLLAGLCFWRFKKGVKESKYNSPTDEFYLVIVEMLNDAANVLWR